MFSDTSSRSVPHPKSSGPHHLSFAISSFVSSLPISSVRGQVSNLTCLFLLPYCTPQSCQLVLSLKYLLHLFFLLIPTATTWSRFSLISFLSGLQQWATVLSSLWNIPSRILLEESDIHNMCFSLSILGDVLLVSFLFRALDHNQLRSPLHPQYLITLSSITYYEI